jgi:hypothetical protein
VVNGAGFFAGEGRYGVKVKTNPPINIDIDMEKMPDGTYVVIEVRKYLNISPHHTLDTLEKFAGTCNMFFNMQPVKLRAPERANHDGILAKMALGEADGVVFKYNGADYLVKTEHSIDLPPGFDRQEYVDEAARAGYKLSFGPIPAFEKGTCEFTLVKDGPAFHAVFKKLRDKEKSDDPVRAASMMGWPLAADFYGMLTG